MEPPERRECRKSPPIRHRSVINSRHRPIRVDINVPGPGALNQTVTWSSESVLTFRQQANGLFVQTHLFWSDFNDSSSNGSISVGGIVPGNWIGTTTLTFRVLMNTIGGTGGATVTTQYCNLTRIY